MTAGMLAGVRAAFAHMPVNAGFVAKVGLSVCKR
jgi:hypothetical protein